ncbi:MAG: biotin-dependent carboxyltransferase [Deltaproteobacteria bacterium]|nr:biotin-dependent carboxyltransferase [Deltaproteobacteria bacterium]
MIALEKAGPLCTVQDLGRPGHRASGMPLAGAMDRLALAGANLLVGNPPGAAGVELSLVGGTWRFEEETLAALCGADMAATLEGEPLAPWCSFRAPRGASLVLGHARSGVRAYLAVRGGIDVPAVLGSRSTYTRARVGGLEGRALRGGDRLPVGAARGRAPAPRRWPGAPPPCGGPIALRAIPGPQEDRFTAEGIATFFSESYRVGPANDRMGYRLLGPPVAHLNGADIITDALLPGAVQVPGSGEPIVLMADAQTTGGYARIATVIGPDLRLLAQARPGDEVRFRPVDQAAAVGALRQERRLLASLARPARGP